MWAFAFVRYQGCAEHVVDSGQHWAELPTFISTCQHMCTSQYKARPLSCGTSAASQVSLQTVTALKNI